VSIEFAMSAWGVRTAKAAHTQTGPGTQSLIDAGLSRPLNVSWNP
jgi:hypothetical protein